MSLFRIALSAQRDLDTIWCYIGGFDMRAADRWLDTVQERFQILATQPHAGQARPDLAPELRCAQKPHLQRRGIHGESAGAMAAQSFRIIVTHSAWADIEDIVAYWTDAMNPSAASNTRRFTGQEPSMPEAKGTTKQARQ